MRDPLSRMSVRHKLAIMFVGLSLIAYGVGGSLVSRSAGEALEEEILARLDLLCRVQAAELDSSLRALMRRAEDFASDGLVRGHAVALQDERSAGEREGLRAELARHLRQNKLPLEPAFANLAVAGVGDELLAVAHDDGALRSDLHPPRGQLADATWVSGLVAPRGDGGPELVLGTPLRDLDGARAVGRLLVVVRVESWVARAAAAATGEAGPRQADVDLVLHDGAGQRLVTSPGAGALTGRWRIEPAEAPPDGGATRYAPVRGTYARSLPVAGSGWSVEVTLDANDALRPVSGLRSRFVSVGVVLGLVSTLLLFFPMRFVARPIVRLEQAAEQLREGALGTRVPVESDDEIGALGRAFNAMADAIQERTRRLETAASELRERQAELRAGRDRLQAVISSMHDGLVVLDAEGRVAMANAAARPLLELVERGALATSHHVCRDRAPGSGCFACLLDAHGPPRSCQVDAAGRTFEIHTTPLPPEGSRGGGRVLVARDVTDRIQRDEREIHNERLAVLGEVAAVVAHELNNPLAAISMFNQMLAAEVAAGSPLRESTEVIARNVEAAKRTIRELLDYATGATPEVGPTDVHAILEDVVRFLRPLSERAGVPVDLVLRARSPEVTGDEVQLRQVFVNLTLNAIQAVAGRGIGPGAGRAAAGARGAGAVTLSTRDEGERLVVDVADTGPGIAPDDRERIFRPFFTTKPRGEGTGLGLPTARRLTEMHGGSLVLVESSPAGTVFRVRLRARTPHAVREAAS